ncbi:hypothetical protein M2R47_08160 [Moraxella sp. Tifton1]|uniref:hypothetical protein n=1 Tax=Moraxella oculi TaxID=2940516 RepID=UPI0020134295|nr:hypothetical protein [Moraxella sp. Tifton1]MCL1624207.1 hypothetical protein [Moraxella sp. Tifton1]
MAVIPLFSASALANTTSADPQQVQIPQLSNKDIFGCQAFLCFAGGIHTPECQSTIRKVTRDLARGKSFPVCPMISNADGSIGGQNGSQKLWTQNTRKRVYVYIQDPDGTVRQVANIRKKGRL